MARRGFRLFVMLPAAVALACTGCAHGDGEQQPEKATSVVTEPPAATPKPTVSPIQVLTVTPAPPLSAPAPLPGGDERKVKPFPVAVPSAGGSIVARPSLIPVSAPAPTVAAVAPAVTVSGPVSVPQLRTTSLPSGGTAAAPPPSQVAAAPVGAPQILGASVSPTVVSSGTKVDATVRTTPEVVAVVAKVAGKTIPVPQIGTGRFAGSTVVPFIPPFFHGSYPVTFVATNARGVKTQAAVNVTVR